MNAKEALNLLDNIAAKTPLSRVDHMRVRDASNAIYEALNLLDELRKEVDELRRDVDGLAGKKSARKKGEPKRAPELA